MIYFIIKTLITAIVVVTVAEIAKRSSLFAGLLVSIPLTSFLAFIWLYWEKRDSQMVIDLSYSILLMVIPSLIHRVIKGENPLVVWGDGSPIRDFIYSTDVARGMMMAVEKGINVPINLGSGDGVKIREIVEQIVKHLPDEREVVWDISKPKGDALRLMDTTLAKKLIGFKTEISLSDGIKETMDWFQENDKDVDNRYNVFTESAS